MINEVLEFLPYLGLAISLNIALGIFKNVGEKKLDFSWKVFFVGLIKSITISYSFIGSAIIYDKLNITLEIANLELTAIQILQSAIALYLVKSLNNLKEIFQVKGDETVKKVIPPKNENNGGISNETDKQEELPIEDETSPEQPNEPKEKIGKERLSFFNADKTKIKRVIDTYKHFKTTFEGITIHNNGNPTATARNDVNWALNELPKVSWHYSVDDKEVVRFLAHPDFWNYSCWCSGDGAKGFGNAKTINIEICEFDGYNNPKDERWLKSRENAIHLVAQLLYDHGWGIDKVGTHKDRSGKNCPRVILKELAQFKKEVNEVLNKLKER